ncbi:MAG: hypothetical protein J2P20_04005 [Pseudonocardia sp.]|nr:hypothetical protein [Pseudonocardia sp.]
MSVLDTLRAAVRRVPRGYPADGRSLGLGLAAAMDAQRARGAEPMEQVARTRRVPGVDDDRHAAAR